MILGGAGGRSTRDAEIARTPRSDMFNNIATSFWVNKQMPRSESFLIKRKILPTTLTTIPSELLLLAVSALAQDADRLSGAKADRPALDRLMRDVRAGKVDRLIVYKLDRLGRSLTHLALILDELNRLKIPLIASSQGIDTSADNP